MPPQLLLLADVTLRRAGVLRRINAPKREVLALRSSQLGVAFRRQVPLLGLIAGFYAPMLEHAR